MSDFAKLLGVCFVACLVMAALIVIMLSPLIIGLIVQDGHASVAWFAGLPISGAIVLAIMATIDRRFG